MKTIAVLTLTAACLMPLTSWSQSYPSRPIKLLIGYTPGGAADVIARIVGDAMSRELGQPIAVENKPGAGSTLASAILSHASPDGYTLGLATATLFGIDQHLYKAKYTPDNFTPITRLTVSPLILAVNKDLGVRNVKELAALVKAKPAALNYSSSGIGGSPHIAGLTFERSIGAAMTHVPYKGGAPALQAVASGEVQLSFGTASSVLPMGQQNRVMMLGVSTPDRSPIAPDLPTLSESGVPGFEFTFWFGLFGPAGLPQDVVDRLAAAAQAALKDGAVKSKLLIGGNVVSPTPSPSAFKTWATKDGQASLDRIVQAGVKVE